MAKLILRFDDRVLKEYPVGSEAVLIGRLPGNAVVIDNPAVSNPHARVLRDGDAFVIEDLQSRNGTFVNEKRVTRQVLQHNDVVLVGKHTLVFDELGIAEPVATADTAPKLPERGATVLLDTRQYRELLAKPENETVVPPPAMTRPSGAFTSKPAAPPRAPSSASSAAPPAASHAAPPAAPRVGVLRVLAGRSDQEEYELASHTSIIGKGETALIRLKGWFKPKVAVAIARKNDSYSITPLGGKTLINGTRITIRHDLKDGDVLQVSGLTLEFRSRAVSPGGAAHG